MTPDERLLGYFPREAAARPEPFTGERLTAGIGGQVAIEHYHRYLFARLFCVDADVLDVASGEGYGAAQLAQVARRVVGVEYATATTTLARENFRRDNLHFVNADARRLPLSDACMDVVVSFETIEHFQGQAAFLAEIRRILRPGGRCIISTPDRDTYAPTGAPTNTHHVRELSRREFTDLLSRHFPHIEILAQRPLLGSALVPETPAAAEPVVFERRHPDRFEATIGLARPVYLIAIASDAPLPSLPASLYIERSDLDTDAQAAHQLRHELARLREELRVSTAALEVRTAQLAAAEGLAAQREQALRAELTALRAEADRTAGSLRRFLRGYLPRLRQHFSRSHRTR